MQQSVLFVLESYLSDEKRKKSYNNRYIIEAVETEIILDRK